LCLRGDGTIWSARLVVLAALALLLALLVPGVALSGEGRLGLEVKWTFNTSDQFEGKVFGAGHQGPPTVWDIDGDGRREILFGTRRGDSKRLWCIEEDGQFQWIYPPIDQDGLPGDPTSVVSLVDVDSDGTYELCLAGRGGRLHVIEPDGSVLWTWDNPDPGQAMHGAPQALDVDGDGFVEFFMNDNYGVVHRVDHEGNLIWTSFQGGSGNQGHPTICDIDRDGEYEVVYANMDFHVYTLSASDGSLEWSFDTGANIKGKPVIVADVNRDGEYEAVTWTDAPASAVFVISSWGEELGRWTLPSEGNIRIGQPMGDVDGDGSLDMAIMSSVGVFVIDIGGETPTTKWGANFTEWSEEGKLPPGARANHWTSYQAIADIDGDDELEIIWLAPFPIVTDGATGRLEAYYWNDRLRLNNRAENGGWWGDVDGDGISEWIGELTGHTRGGDTLIYALTMGGQFPAESPWPEYYHSVYPGEYQQEQDWLTLKGAYSNSVWFPIEMQVSEVGGILTCVLLIVAVLGAACQNVRVHT
jgi:hypothetical protein